LSVVNRELNLVDPYNGQQDLKNKVLRAVGNPEQRFQEDALRLMRAVRLASEFGFEIESETQKALKKNSSLLKQIAKERVRDELTKLLMTKNAKRGIEQLETFGLLKYVVPEVREGIDVGQNKHHIYSVWEHNLLALDYAAKKDFSLELRLASLLHDVGKPRTKRGEGESSTFHGHEIVGARMTKRILEDLKFSKEIVGKVAHLVRYHLFYYNVGEVTEAGVRRFISRVGVEHIDDLMKLRQSDRIGSGVPKAIPYKIRHLLFMIDKVRKDPISPKMLKIDGLKVMEILKIQPGPKVGWILGILLDEVLEDPKKNTEAYLEKRAGELGKLQDVELLKMFEKSRETKSEFEAGQEEELKKKFYV
jgi:poly(A) polymerase/tRNA nucleotidyltransferase (CCA-adding enzyme)